MLLSYLDLMLSYRKDGVMSLAERTRTGLKEMPSNAAWLLARARDRRQQISAAVVDAAPVGDSVEIRMRRAREAAERGRESEERADYAQQVNERGRARLAEVHQETSRRIKQRVAEAQKAADEMVKR